MSVRIEMEQAPVRAGRDVLSAPLAVRTVGVCLGVVGLMAVVALVLMYILEIGPGLDAEAHVYGPISDVLSVTWNVLLIALILAFRPTGVAPALVIATIMASAAGALASLLLVVGVLPFPVSTSVSVAALIVQSGWLLVLGQRLREVSGWGGIGRLSRYIGLGVLVGVPVFGASLLFPWGSVPQLVIMGAAIVPGFAAWVCVPVWAILVGRRAGHPTSPVGLPSGNSALLGRAPLHGTRPISE